MAISGLTDNTNLANALAAKLTAASATAAVATQQSTTSTSFTDLATAGPAVTLTTGTKALVIITAQAQNDTSGAYSYMSFAVSGASTVAASDTWGRFLIASAVNRPAERSSVAHLITGLTAGSNTFTLKYKNASGTAFFENRSIIVIDMGS